MSELFSDKNISFDLPIGELPSASNISNELFEELRIIYTALKNLQRSIDPITGRLTVTDEIREQILADNSLNYSLLNERSKVYLRAGQDLLRGQTAKLFSDGLVRRPEALGLNGIVVRLVVASESIANGDIGEFYTRGLVDIVPQVSPYEPVIAPRTYRIPEASFNNLASVSTVSDGGYNNLIGMAITNNLISFIPSNSTNTNSNE